jgi:hypothetical protein
VTPLSAQQQYKYRVCNTPYFERWFKIYQNTEHASRGYFHGPVNLQPGYSATVPRRHVSRSNGKNSVHLRDPARPKKNLARKSPRSVLTADSTGSRVTLLSFFL